VRERERETGQERMPKSKKSLCLPDASTLALHQKNPELSVFIESKLRQRWRLVQRVLLDDCVPEVIAVIFPRYEMCTHLIQQHILCYQVAGTLRQQPAGGDTGEALHSEHETDMQQLVSNSDSRNTFHDPPLGCPEQFLNEHQC
jgi:hypothetical protein